MQYIATLAPLGGNLTRRHLQRFDPREPGPDVRAAVKRKGQDTRYLSDDGIDAMMSMLRTTTAARVSRGIDQGLRSAHAALTVAERHVRDRLATTGRDWRPDRKRATPHGDPERDIPTPHGSSGPCTHHTPARAARETQALESAARAATDWRRRHPHRGVPTAPAVLRLGDNPLIPTDGEGISHIMGSLSFSRLRFVRVTGKAVEKICDSRGISGAREFQHANWLDMKHIMFPSIDADGIHWRLIVIHVQTKEVAFYDPFGTPDSAGDCAAVLQWLQWVIVNYPETAGRHPRAGDFTDGPPTEHGWTINTQAMPGRIQADGHSCGVHIVQIAESIIAGQALLIPAQTGAGDTSLRQAATATRWRYIRALYNGHLGTDSPSAAAGTSLREAAAAVRAVRSALAPSKDRAMTWLATQSACSVAELTQFMFEESMTEDVLLAAVNSGDELQRLLTRIQDAQQERVRRARRPGNPERGGGSDKRARR